MLRLEFESDFVIECPEENVIQIEYSESTPQIQPPIEIPTINRNNNNGIVLCSRRNEEFEPVNGIESLIGISIITEIGKE